MSGRDPFDFGDDEGDRTVIRPAPSQSSRAPVPPSQPADADEGDRTRIGAAPPRAATPATRAADPFTPAELSLGALETVGPNPLVAAAAPLIALASALRATPRHDDVPHLRQQVVEQLRAFQAAARAKGAREEDLRYGHYALCALTDEVVLSTPWGAKSGWPKQSLVATFHNEVVSGNRMFEVAEALEQRPSRSPDLLELIYLCMSFGFEGRFRLDPQGANRLMRLRERLYEAIRRVRGPYERALSPQWRGVQAAYQPLARQVPLWVYGAALALLALLIYAGFTLALGAQGRGAAATLAGAYQAEPSRLNRSAAAPAEDHRLFTTILDILKPDIDAGRVGVTESPDAVLVRLLDKGLFASGSATLDPAYGETMERVAKAIGLTVGDVPVTGHTDDQPVHALQFPSNQALSEARAATVVDKLKAAGVPEARLKPSGLGETQPVADNATAEGRRRNRRVEVSIPKTYAEAQP